MQGEFESIKVLSNCLPINIKMNSYTEKKSQLYYILLLIVKGILVSVMAVLFFCSRYITSYHHRYIGLKADH